jgi:V/A-type H+-transporting ATPase subunit I
VLVPMAKVEIIGPKSRFFEVVSLLHDQGTLHIEDLSKKIDSGEVPLDQMEVEVGERLEQERMEDLLIRVRAIIQALHFPGAEVDEIKRQREYLRLWKMDTGELANEVTGVIDEVEDKTSSLAASQTDLEAEIGLLSRYEPILHKIQPLAKQIVTTGQFESVALLVERRYKGALEQLKEELDKITKKQCEIVSTDVDEDTTAAIVVFSKTYSDPVHKFLAMENVNQIRLPSDMQGMPFDEAYKSIKERRKSLPGQLEDVRKELEAMSHKWYLVLSTIRDVLADKIEEISAIPKFGQTSYAFVVTGWLPVDDLSGLRKGLKASFGDDVIVNQTEIDEKDFGDTPVAMKNSKIMAPFEFLVAQRGIPKYGTMDPTWMLFIFYPLFFGMIVGDIGYGLLMLGLVVWLRIKGKDNAGMQLATSILGPATTMVIIFGVLYGEFFGNFLGKEYLNVIRPINVVGVVLPFNRVEFVTVFMYIAIAVGIIQVMLSFVFGIVNAIRTKSRHHLWERGGLLALFLGIMLAVVVGVALPNFGNWTTAGQVLFAVVALAGFVFAIRGGGIMGVIEMLEGMSHIASYIRIMAVGLAGAIFADAVNGIMHKYIGNPPTVTGVILAVFIGVLLHGLNLLLSAFSPTIHALRLNFLEFFGGFFEAGKQEYKPFQKTGGEKSA